VNIGRIPAKTARLDPAREALIDVPNNRRISYGELDQRIRRLANGLCNTLELPRGARVHAS
jgi:acyl-CoA synthetase (AMP-forming)/AMP-acid ligase II